MHPGETFNELPIGLFELDGFGTVLYYKPERGSEPPALAPEVVGRNFFDDIVSVKQSREFQELIRDFGRGHQPARNFTFTLRNGRDAGQPVKVLLARMHEHSAGSPAAESVFVHIKKA